MCNNSFYKLLNDKFYKKAAHEIIEDNSLIEECMKKFFEASDIRFNQKFSNVLQIIKIDNSSILKPYYSEWISILKSPKNNSIHRNTYRYFQDAMIPEKFTGLLYNHAFEDMQCINNPITIKVFAMTTCHNIAKMYPELLPELKEIIKIVSVNDSPGIKSRSSKILKQIDKQLKLI